MNAIDYVKQNGIEKARVYLEKMNAENWHNGFYSDLKQIVDAFELVDQCGGLEDVKLYDLSNCKSKPDSMGYKLMKAINLVEKCR